jgi:hypothetical protein
MGQGANDRTHAAAQGAFDPHDVAVLTSRKHRGFNICRSRRPQAPYEGRFAHAPDRPGRFPAGREGPQISRKMLIASHQQLAWSRCHCRCGIFIPQNGEAADRLMAIRWAFRWRAVGFYHDEAAGNDSRKTIPAPPATATVLVAAAALQSGISRNRTGPLN